MKLATMQNGVSPCFAKSKRRRFVENATSSSYSSWKVVAATPASFTESMLWYHLSIRSNGRSQSGVQA